MAVSGASPRPRAFRALLAAHLHTAWNRSAREMGRQGAWMVGLVATLTGLLAAGPLFAGMGVLGWMLGSRFDQPLAPVLLGAGLALAGLGGGSFGGLAGGARQLNWETYRGYPLKRRVLYAAELVAGLGDPLPLLLGLGLLGLLTGVGVGCPAALPLVPLVFLETLGFLLALQLLVGGLAEALVKRLRLALTLLAVLAWAGSTLATARLPREPRAKAAGPRQVEQRAQAKALARRGSAILAVLPTHASALSLARAGQGRWGEALALHLYPLAALALLMALGARLLAREGRTGTRARGSGGPGRLWSFRHPAEGIGRLHLRTLLASHLGRFALLMPVMTLVLIKGPFAQVRGQAFWVVPAAFAYLSLVGNNLALNQFGLDRHGIKTLLLLPVTARDLLLGKLLGLAVHQGLQALLLALLLGVFDGARPPALIAGLLMLGCIFLMQAALGQWTSLWAPRPMALDSLKNNHVPLAVGLLSLAASGLWMGLFGGLYALTAWLAPAWLVPVLGAAFLLSLAAHLALLPSAAAYLERRREVLVERLG